MQIDVILDKLGNNDKKIYMFNTNSLPRSYYTGNIFRLQLFKSENVACGEAEG